MRSQSAKPCRRFVLLTLALSACGLQVLRFSLPSLVVCQRADRPPRLEFFSDACSCRHVENVSWRKQAGHVVSDFEPECTDIPLKSPVLLPAAVHLPPDSFKGQRRSVESGRRALEPAFSGWLRLPDNSGVPRAESPPPTAFPDANSRLRC